MLKKLKTLAVLSSLLSLSVPSVAAISAAELKNNIEKELAVQTLQQQYTEKEQAIIKAVQSIAENDIHALGHAMEKGLTPNERYEFLKGANLLLMAISAERWEAVFYFLQNGGNLDAKVGAVPGLEKYSSDTLGEILRTVLYQTQKDQEDVSITHITDPYFWQCKLVLYHKGYQAQTDLHAPFPATLELAKAYTTWTLVTQHGAPVPFAAAFANNIELMLALNLTKEDNAYFRVKEGDTIYSINAFEEGLVKRSEVYTMRSNAQSTPYNWVYTWMMNHCPLEDIENQVKYRKILTQLTGIEF